VKTDNQKNPKNKKQKQPPENYGHYARYSGLAFQMLAAILLGLWIGMKIDEYMGNKNPVFTAISTVLFIFASLYLVIKSLPKS
jgi:F0F1-type ATP synthase assembly protein I